MTGILHIPVPSNDVYTHRSPLMPMIQAIQQYPLPVRIPALKEAVLRCRAVKEGAARDEAEWMDLLAQAEASAGGTDVPLSGLIPEGQNPHAASAPAAPPGYQGDLINPQTGESSGGALPTGSVASPEHGSSQPQQQLELPFP